MYLPPERRDRLRKKSWKQRKKPLRKSLLAHQLALRDADFPVLLVFAGVDGAGKHETVNLLNKWLDPRFIRTLAYEEATQEERERPELWRYWRDLPARGEIGMVLSGWYSQPLLDRVMQREDDAGFRRRLAHAARFERMLADDGALILKFWMHLDLDQQQDRLRNLAADPEGVWRIRPRDWSHLQLYDRFVEHADTLIDSTNAEHAPWTVIDGGDPRRRHLIVAETLDSALGERLRNGPPAPPKPSYKPTRATRLARLDLSATLDKDEYKARMKQAKARLGLIQRTSEQLGRATVMAFEGWDAAGKGGAIWRMTRALDARRRNVTPIAAPDDQERAHHYLWRFWRHIPRAGHLQVFDRSWYGRVLIERVEQLQPPAVWQRAYDEINDFEAQLSESGIRLIKFWLHISPEEQLARFKAREQSPLKEWKLTEEDWRNREKWDDYQHAVEDMLARTDTPHAPWILVPANDKRLARVTVLEAACDRLEDWG
jgi:polyphosphate:AMP phosphotransferase